MSLSSQPPVHVGLPFVIAASMPGHLTDRVTTMKNTTYLLTAHV